MGLMFGANTRLLRKVYESRLESPSSLTSIAPQPCSAAGTREPLPPSLPPPLVPSSSSSLVPGVRFGCFFSERCFGTDTPFIYRRHKGKITTATRKPPLKTTVTRGSLAQSAICKARLTDRNTEG